MAKAPTISAGPSSSNDGYTVSEDQIASGAVIFDVLANDAKRLPIYSLDNRDVSDLLNQDRVNLAEQSQLGNSIWITSDGRVAFGPGLNSSQLQTLALGETRQDSFIYAVRHPNGSLVWSTVQVTITGQNDAPVARGDTGLAIEDALTTGSVASNDSDVDNGAVLQYAATGPVPAGFAMAGDGSWTFDGSDPAYQGLSDGETLQLAIPYAVTDEHGATGSATLVLTLVGRNDAPLVSGAVAGSATEDGAASTVDALARASDVDEGTTLTVVNVPAELPPGVSYDPTSKSFTLDPTNAAYQGLAQGATAAVTVGYGVSDGTAVTPASVSWTVTGTNDVPTVTGVVLGEAAEDGPGVTLSALANATDVDTGTSLSVVSLPAELPPGVSYDPTSKSFTLDPSHAAYQALAQGAATTITVNYGVSDGTATTAASVSWTVTGFNDGPVASAATATVGEDQAAGGALVATDVDEGSSLIFEPYTGGPDGFALNSDGSWTFDANQPEYQSLGEGESRDVAIDYVVTDDQGETSVSTLTVTVTGANDAPTASAATATVSEDGLVSGTVVVSDPDASASLTVEPRHDSPLWFEMDSDGNWTFDANQAEYQALAEGESQDVVIHYDVADAEGAYAYSTVTITVTGANDAPVTTSQWAEADEGGTATGTLLALDQDNGAELSFAVDGEAPAGFLLNPNGSWTFDGTNSAYDGLSNGEVRLIEVPFTVTDEHGATSSSFMTIALTGSNDAPVHSGDPVALAPGSEDTVYVVTQEQLLAGWSDPEGAGLVVTNLNATNATVTDNGDGSFTIQPATNFNGDVELAYDVSDGSASVAAARILSVAAVNDPAVIGGVRSGSATEATPFGPGVPTASGQLSVADPDDDPSFVSLSDVRSSGGYGTVTLTAAGLWQYALDNSHSSVNVLNNGQTLTDSFTVTTVDGTTSTVSITINGGTDTVRQPNWYFGTGDPNDFSGSMPNGNPSAEVWDTTGNDTLVGTDADQTLYSLSGYDTIYGQGGNDRIHGLGSSGGTLYGQGGDDFLSGGGGSNLLYGGTGEDEVRGGGSADQLYGGSELDSLYGFGGDDLLVGGYGIDNLTGGAGADTFRFLDLRDTGDHVIDFAYGTDFLDFAALDANQNVAGDQALAWGGTTPGAYTLWAAQSGTSTHLYADTDGNPQTAEFMVTLSNSNFWSIADPQQVPDGFIL